MMGLVGFCVEIFWAQLVSYLSGGLVTYSRLGGFVGVWLVILFSFALQSVGTRGNHFTAFFIINLSDLISNLINLLSLTDQFFYNKGSMINRSY